MAETFSFLARLSLKKTGFEPSSGDINKTTEVLVPEGINQTQNLVSNTIEALDVGDVALPCGKILVKLIDPAAIPVEFSTATGGGFDAARFGVIKDVNDAMLWTPKLSTIYVKAIGADARIQVIAG